MGISLTEAAKLVGMSKNGIVKAIKAGKISGGKNVHGQWEVDPAELTRVYKALEPVSTSQTDTVRVGENNKTSQLEREIELQREQINLLREQMSRNDDNHAKVVKVLEEHITTQKSRKRVGGFGRDCSVKV